MNDRREIFGGFVAQVRIERRRDGVGGGVDEDGGAIGIRLGDGTGRSGSSRARTVFDDDAPSELRRDLLEHEPRHDVGDGAGRERHDHAQRPRRPVVLCLDDGSEKREGEG